MNYLITGGTGLIGRYLSKRIIADNDTATIYTRQNLTNTKNISYIQCLKQIDKSTKYDVVINLAGETIAKYWTKAYKKKLIDSRVNTTNELIKVVNDLHHKPEVFLQCSAIGYYGNVFGDIDEQTTPAPGFTHDLCKSWENATNNLNEEIRLVTMRLGVVLARDGGIIKQLYLSTKLGIGAVIADGSQYFSFIHIKDLIDAINYLIKTKSCHGIYNLTTTMTTTNSEFMYHFGKVLNRKVRFYLPEILVKLLFGEMGQSLLIDGQKVLPKKLVSENFKLKYNSIESSLGDIFR